MEAVLTSHAKEQVKAYNLSAYEIQGIEKREGTSAPFLTDWDSGGVYHFDTLRVSESEIDGAGRYIISLVEERDGEPKVLSVHAVPEEFAGRVRGQITVNPVAILKAFASRFGLQVRVGNKKTPAFIGDIMGEGFEVVGEGNALREYLTAPQDEGEKKAPQGTRMVRVLLATAIDTAAVREELGPR